MKISSLNTYFIYTECDNVKFWLLPDAVIGNQNESWVMGKLGAVQLRLKKDSGLMRAAKDVNPATVRGSEFDRGLKAKKIVFLRLPSGADVQF